MGKNETLETEKAHQVWEIVVSTRVTPVLIVDSQRGRVCWISVDIPGLCPGKGDPIVKTKEIEKLVSFERLVYMSDCIVGYV